MTDNKRREVVSDSQRLMTEEGAGKLEDNGKDGWPKVRGSVEKRRGREGEEPKEVDGGEEEADR